MPSELHETTTLTNSLFSKCSHENIHIPAVELLLIQIFYILYPTNISDILQTLELSFLSDIGIHIVVRYISHSPLELMDHQKTAFLELFYIYHFINHA